MKAGKDYPTNISQYRAMFPTDADCLDYLDWLRFGDGFVCPKCGVIGGTKQANGLYSCKDCGTKTSVTAGTIFARTQLPLSVWFEAAWLITSAKSGTSAKAVQRQLGLHSYQTAWTMLHKYRTAMRTPDRKLLSGTVEVDESFVGGYNKPGKKGRGASGKVLVGVMVEANGKYAGRLRMTVLPDASATSLEQMLTNNIEPGSIVCSDGWSAYPKACANNYTLKPINISQSGQPAHVSLPHVHRVAALYKRFWLGTLQGGVKPEHLQSYLDEFVFRFNRRTSRHPGLLFYRLLQNCVATPPTSYKKIVANPGQAKKITPIAPTSRNLTGSATLDPMNRPWRK